MKNMKKWLALALACVMMIGTLIIVPISANEGTASVTVLDKNNIAINMNTNELYLQYAVDATVPSGATLEVGLYSNAEATDKIATAVASGETIEGTNYEIYNTPAINMINIDVTFYAKAVITNGDEVLASSDVVACSVEDYMTKRAEAADVTEVETNLFAAIRAYAAAAKAFKEAMTPVEPTPDPEPELPTEWTVADALAAEEGTEVVLTGTVSGIYQAYNSTFGNVSVYITDATGEILAFRMTATSEKDYVVGDVITVTGTITFYDGSNSNQIAQGCTAEMVTKHVCEDYASEKTSCTDEVKCTSCGTLIEEAGSHTEPNAEGKCDACGELLVVDEAQTYTFDVTGFSSGSGYTTRNANGWKVVNTNYSTSDFPGQKVIILNGKTSGKGELTSALLTTGIQQLNFNYGNPFKETKGVDITISILQNGGVVASQRLDDDSVTIDTAYSFTWTLDEAIEGEFTINIVNNSPSNSTSNQDRVAIWNIEWVGYAG